MCLYYYRFVVKQNVNCTFLNWGFPKLLSRKLRYHAYRLDLKYRKVEILSLFKSLLNITKLDVMDKALDVMVA